MQPCTSVGALWVCSLLLLGASCTTPTAKLVAAILAGDPARAQGLDSKIYNGWSNITLPIEDPGNAHTLFLVFRGENSGMLLQLDWIDFNGPAMHVETDLSK